MKIFRYLLFIAFCVGVAFYAVNKRKSKAQHSFQWQRSTFAERGHDPKALDSLLALITNGDYGYVDEILIAQGDQILIQERFLNDYRKISAGKTGKMGCGYGACEDSSAISLYNYYHPQYHPYYKDTRLHTLQSVTKSVIATVMGIAIANIEGLSVENPLAPYFQEWELTPEVTAHLEQTTIKDILTMRLGLHWKEMGLTLEQDTDATLMELSEDWIGFVLDQGVSTSPDSVWNYSSGATMLLSEIIRQETGMQVSDYAKKHLFDPLGIENYFWKTTPTGLTDTEGGLYLMTEDLAKIGLLYLQEGTWMGRQLLSPQWVADSFQKYSIDLYGDGGEEGYGYQWWITGITPPDIVGLGYGGQSLLISPDNGVVVVINSWNVFDNEAANVFGGLLPVLKSIKTH
ncbi:MAG: serine hydrolase [Bacteroidota bacterium]